MHLARILANCTSAGSWEEAQLSRQKKVVVGAFPAISSALFLLKALSWARRESQKGCSKLNF